MATQSSPNNSGAYLQTTNAFDIAPLQDVNVTSPEFKELLVKLYQSLNNMALLLNMKDTGFYVTDREFVCGQSWFPNPALSSKTPATPTFRNAYRKVINFGTLPNNGVPVTKAHGITCTTNTSFTRIYAVATDPVNKVYKPIPYASAADVAHNIELSVDATNVTITSGGADYSAFTICYVVLEYLKS